MSPSDESNPESASAYSERRAQVRIPVRVEVRFEEVGQAARALKAFSSNVSSGGLCLRTQHVYPVGHVLQLSLTIEGHTLSLRGAVAWTRKDAVGVRFIDVEPGDRERLDAVVKSLSASRG